MTPIFVVYLSNINGLRQNLARNLLTVVQRCQRLILNNVHILKGPSSNYYINVNKHEQTVEKWTIRIQFVFSRKKLVTIEIDSFPQTT